MFSKKNRLKKRDEFNLTFKKGKTFKNRFLKVKVKKVKNEEKKIGFVAPVKIFKKAVERNKVKRMLREAFKPFLEKIPEGNYIILIAKKGIEKKELEEIEREINKILIQANILK